jgi:AcrR family transcriptional regulator
MNQPYHHGALRTALLAAAETILERDGLNALTLRAAAREAGVSHGAPAHHFTDLTGLLTALAASGFERLREHLVKETTGVEPQAYVIAVGRAYLGFARAHHGIFLLMFRSERLDWSSPALSSAGSAAFALLTPEGERGAGETLADLETLIAASTRWSLMHGLATLLLEGQLGGMASKVEGADVEQVIEAVLTRGLSAPFKG